MLGWLALTSAWALAGYDAELGRDLRAIGLWLGGFLGAAMLLNYPWTPGYARSLGCGPEGG